MKMQVWPCRCCVPHVLLLVQEDDGCWHPRAAHVHAQPGAQRSVHSGAAWPHRPQQGAGALLICPAFLQHPGCCGGYRCSAMAGERQILPAGLKVATAIEHSSSLCLLHRMLQWQVCWTSVCLDARMAQLAGLPPATQGCFRQWQVPRRGLQETLKMLQVVNLIWPTQRLSDDSGHADPEDVAVAASSECQAEE